MLGLITDIFFFAALLGGLALLAAMLWRERKTIARALLGAPTIETRFEPVPLSLADQQIIRRALKRSVVVRKILRRDA